MESYDPTKDEKKWTKFWEDEKIYAFDPKSVAKKKPRYSIDTPPPTVSGSMHVGHAFSYAQEDIIARYRRMKGDVVFFPFGTDDNGLPTERLVEKMKQVTAKEMPREKFIDLCNRTISEIKQEFVQDWKDMGISADYASSYSTIDKNSIKASQRSFLDIYRKGAIYSEESPFAWCVNCRTAIAQAEFDNVEMDSTFNDIAFSAGSERLIVATTRPELLPACVALCAHPDDKRYKKLKGKKAKVPLFGHEVPIIFDETASIEKGTGLMMVCTFGDKEDIEKWRKHNLPLKVAIDEKGLMTSEAGRYAGLKIKAARKSILEDLQKGGLLLGQKRIRHAVNVHERCGTEIELLKTRQWFIRVLDRKGEFVKAADKITWYPEFMKKRYVNWVENLQWDWCISRQRHFGVPFPLWRSKKTGEAILADESQLPVDPLGARPKKLPAGHTYEDIEPEKDVMDTWATSSITPQIALRWADKDKMFDAMFPMTVRMQAHEIIRTWTFYTIVKSIYMHGKVPWNSIMLSGYVLDPKGEKMSKSKGNAVTPQDVLGKYGADAVRYWAAGSKLGEDTPYHEKDVVMGKKTVTKLFNASKFTFMNLEGYEPEPLDAKELEIMDRWLLSHLIRVIKTSTEAFESYEYYRAKQETDSFFWQRFCDNYLEIIKHRMYGADGKSKHAAQSTLYYALFTQLRLFAPMLPYITEEVYQEHFRKHEKRKSIHLADWPEFDRRLVDEEAMKAGDLAVQVVSEIRKYKSSKQLSMKAEVKNITISCTKEQRARLELVLDDIKATGSVGSIGFSDSDEFGVAFN